LTTSTAAWHDDRALLYAFALLELDGEDFRPHPLHASKARLEQLLAAAPVGIQYNEGVEGDGQLAGRMWPPP
jgi:ATP-dependent DNA ligase